MDATDFSELVGPALAGALAAKGFTELTPVQSAVLDPELEGRDLRISSQTGSGKTVAIGFVLRACIDHPVKSGAPGIAKPRALIVAPTRELARQVEEELTWLYAPLRARVASATGGASYRTELRALGSGPVVVVGTPGRLLDHLKRGAIDLSGLEAVVLDEADRMLEMGFREELEAILSHAPQEHRTHLVSATFPREVKALADRVQVDPAHVEGTRLGEANADIEHHVHLIDPDQRVDAIVNLLLANPDEQVLIFARTRADVAWIAEQLEEAGFEVGALSGELEQVARDRALGAFRKGQVRALVATDVAARGIDVQDIARVIHADPPGDSNGYTHRSGRTGRAGRKGTSSVLVPLSAFRKTSYLLRSAGVSFEIKPLPSAEEIESAADERLLQELTGPEPEGFKGYDDRTWALAKQLSESDDPTRVFARLLRHVAHEGTPAARKIRDVKLPTDRKPFPDRKPFSDRSSFPDRRPFPDRVTPAGRGPASDRRYNADQPWVLFRVSWGQLHGADVRRLLAVVCRRGAIEGGEVGTIRVGPTFSTVEVRAGVAQQFAEAAQRPDPRNPKVRIEEDRWRAPTDAPAPTRPAYARPAPERSAPERSAPERSAPERSAPERPAPERSAPARPAPARPAPAREYATAGKRGAARAPERKNDQDKKKKARTGKSKGKPRDRSTGDAAPRKHKAAR